MVGCFNQHNIIVYEWEKPYLVSLYNYSRLLYFLKALVQLFTNWSGLNAVWMLWDLCTLAQEGLALPVTLRICTVNIQDDDVPSRT